MILAKSTSWATLLVPPSLNSTRIAIIVMATCQHFRVTNKLVMMNDAPIYLHPDVVIPFDLLENSAPRRHFEVRWMWSSFEKSFRLGS